MALYQNVVGEGVPDETTVHVTVMDGEIIEVRTEQMAGGPLSNWPAGAGAKIATAYTAATFPDNSVLDQGTPDRGTLTTIQKQDRFLVLMDCGRWGGPMGVGGPQQRCFGLVWGGWAALCEYFPNNNYANDQNLVLDTGTGKPIAGFPINELLVQLRGNGGASIKLIKAEWSPTPATWQPDWNTLYLILPDFHLPVSARTSGQQTTDGPCMGRYKYCEPYIVPDPAGLSSNSHLTQHPNDESFVNDALSGKQVFSRSGDTWFDRYRAGDIFGNATNSAVRDLVDFAARINAAAHRTRIHFVQLGDMYDLWIGLDAFFSEQPTQTVMLKNSSSILAGNFIDFWCNRTNEIFDRTPIPDPANPGATKPAGMISALTGLSVKQKSWIWGNHDNYLAAHTPAGIPPRVRDVRGPGVFIDHGQRYDPVNRDGAVSGQQTTNTVFEFPVIRSFDPTRRGYYTSGATTSYLVQPDFGIYVMGHTHSPYLTRVRIKVREQPKVPPRPHTR
jgi:hypothetical protein